MIFLSTVWKEVIDKIKEGQKKAKLPISATDELLSGKVREPLEALAEIAAELNPVEMVTPVNAAEEKEKWLELAQAGYLTDPVFRYDPDILQNIGLSGKLARLVKAENDFKRMRKANELDGEYVLRTIIQRRFDETKAIVRAAKAIFDQEDDIRQKCLNVVFPKVSPELVDAANAEADRLAAAKREPVRKCDSILPTLLSERERFKLQHLKFDAEEIRKYFWRAAKMYGFEETRPIKVSALATSIDVRDKSSVGPIVVIPQDRKVSGLKLLELIAHEIEGHWRDSENAQAVLPLLGGGALKASDEILYEGHAMTLESQTKLALKGLPSEAAKPWYILAIDLASKGNSFSQTASSLFSRMRPTENDDEATYRQVWTTCLRVYRGLRNTTDNSYGYALAKDQAYFAGQILANELHANGLGYLLDFSTLSISDLVTLAATFKIKLTDIEYRHRADVLPTMAGMLLSKYN